MSRFQRWASLFGIVLWAQLVLAYTADQELVEEIKDLSQVEAINAGQLSLEQVAIHGQSVEKLEAADSKAGSSRPRTAQKSPQSQRN